MPFEFSYEVSDPKTDNEQSHTSKSDGEVTEGSYSVKLPDGRTQTVTYSSDKNTGFVAEVTYTGEIRPSTPGGGGGASGGGYGRQLQNGRGRRFSDFPNGIGEYGVQKRESLFDEGSSSELSIEIDRLVEEKIREYAGKSLDSENIKAPPKKFSNKSGKKTDRHSNHSKKKQHKSSLAPKEDNVYHREIPEELIHGRTFMVPFLQNLAHLQKTGNSVRTVGVVRDV